MTITLPLDSFLHFSPPNEQSSPPQEWANQQLIGSPNILELGRQKIAFFDNFPPEYIDYYKALQEEIARRIPSEQERPFICLNIKGKTRLHELSPADIGMAGGTGPLSDATALENLVCHMSKIKKPLSEDRAKVAREMENFSGVMYSMPPFRDAEHAWRDFRAYRNLYRAAREYLPCTSLHILTNTGHSNKWVFNSKIFFGSRELGDVDDMTVKVADRIQKASKSNESVLVLGTKEADEAKLYPNLLIKRGLNPVLPTQQFKTQEAKEYLQSIINQAKAGLINDPMPNESRSCGQAFIDFVVHYVRVTGCQSLLFSCTELPMLLHTEVSGKTYLEILKEELNKLPNKVEYKFYDTEEIFVEEMALKSQDLQSHPELRSTYSTETTPSTTYSLHYQLNEIKQEIEAHCNRFINKTDEKHIHKRNVLMATLRYFEDGDADKFDSVVKNNPRYSEAFMLWGSTTLALVYDGVSIADQIKSEAGKNKSDSNDSGYVENKPESSDNILNPLTLRH